VTALERRNKRRQPSRRSNAPMRCTSFERLLRGVDLCCG
jgi:hypothetical protein